MKGFIDVKLEDVNIDNFIIRTAIFKGLKEVLPSFNGEMLDIGCGKMPYKEYILRHSNIDIYVGLDIANSLNYDENIKADYTWNGITMPFKENTFECAFGTEVLEHCPEPEITLGEVFRVLKPGGIFFFTVPFLWNLHETPNDEYRYTPYSLERHLKKSGFETINIKATGGWHTSMAQMLGLWVKRSPMNSKKRKLLLKCLKPIIKYLIRKGSQENIEFRDGLMITGLIGTAIK